MIKFVIDFAVKNEIFHDEDDFEEYFPSFNYSNAIDSVCKTKEAIEWAYKNDDLEYFYSQFFEELIDLGIPNLILNCEIITKSSIVTTMWYDLYQFESKNLFYFKVIGSGENHECWDTSDIFRITDKESQKAVIDNFKDNCMEIFTLNGDLSFDELMKEGHEINFH